MKRAHCFVLLAAWFAFSFSFTPAEDRVEKADLVIENSRIYTLDPANPWAQAVAIKGDRILWTGEYKHASTYTGPATKVIDAGGKLMLPGFIDSHFHVLLGSNPNVLRISNANSLKEIQRQVSEFADSHPHLAWIEAEGWNYSAFPDGNLPNASDLAGIGNGRPMFLVAYDYHTIWLNNEALRRFQITRETESVSFAEEVQKKSKTGEPTGILIGFGSSGLSEEAEEELRRVLPSHSPDSVKRSIEANVNAAVKTGITTIVDPQSFPEDLPIYQELFNAGKLPARLQVALFHRRGTGKKTLEAFLEAQRLYNNDRIRVSAVKLYIDDVIEPHTAAMLAPYSDRPNEKGSLLYEPEEFNQVVSLLDRMKFQIFIHAIGDRGIRTALDSLQYARDTNGARDSRHQLVHIECLSPQDVPRFKQLGVTACMQPRHCAPDITGQWAKAVGPVRSQYSWAFRSLRDSGALLAFASDWNVAEMDPLIGIYTALTRKGLDGKPPNGWIPQQTIDLDTSIRAYTINGAYANFLETNRGSITSGKYADLVLLSDDIFHLPPDQIKDVHVIRTIIGGKEVFSLSPDPVGN